MPFSVQPPAAPASGEMDDLHQDAGPDMLWASEQDFDGEGQFNQIFNLTQQNNAFVFQNDPAASNISPYSFLPFVHVPISQTGPPFRATQSKVSDFRKYMTDDVVPGKRGVEDKAAGHNFEQAQQPSCAIQFNASQLRAITDTSDCSPYEFRPKGQTYQEFMPMPVTTPGTINRQPSMNSPKGGGLFGPQPQILAHPPQQGVPGKRSRKRPRRRASPLPPSMSLPDSSTWGVPGLSSTASTLDSTVDEIVSGHAASVIENWLHHFPTVHIPTDDDFRALAILTRLKVETVRMWFGQRLRREPAEFLVANSNCLQQENLVNTDTSISQSSSGRAPVHTGAPVTLPTLQRRVLREAARWVRERGTKCTINPDFNLLRRYEPRPYQCTLGCGKNFDKRADWRRHEEINYPKQGWVCDLAFTTIQAGVRQCTFCGVRNPLPNHMQQAHSREVSCHSKSMADAGKISYRKDKFAQHFTNTHPGVNCSSYYDNSHFLVASRFPGKCGFCATYLFKNWQDRITHIGDHFSNDGYDMTRWQVLEVEDDDESNRRTDEDDEDFDGDSNERTDGSGKGFDRHDHDYDHDEFSDFSEDDSDDFPPGPAPKQRAHIENKESLAVSTPEDPSFPNQNSVFVRRMRGPIAARTQHTTALFENRRRPQNSERMETEHSPFFHGESSPLLSGLPQTRFTRIRVLGIGPYSVVDEVQDWRTGYTLARKTVHYTTQRTFKALKAEVEIMKKLKHPHIVRFVGEYIADHSLSILMTPSADFDLDYLMDTDVNYVDTVTVVQWFSCLVSSVDYLHSHCIKHQDIKPSNILIRGNTIFLADFGVAKTFNEFDSTTSTSGNMTRKYCSPETARDGYRGRKSDIFSLGCVFLEMLSFLLQDNAANFLDYQWKTFTGDGVYHENLSQITEWLHHLRKIGTTTVCRLDLSQAIESCETMLEIDPRDRPTAEELTVQFVPGDCCESPFHTRQKPMVLRRIMAVMPFSDACPSKNEWLPVDFGTKLSPGSSDKRTLVEKHLKATYSEVPGHLHSKSLQPELVERIHLLGGFVALHFCGIILTDSQSSLKRTSEIVKMKGHDKIDGDNNDTEKRFTISDLYSPHDNDSVKDSVVTVGVLTTLSLTESLSRGEFLHHLEAEVAFSSGRLKADQELLDPTSERNWPPALVDQPFDKTSTQSALWGIRWRIPFLICSFHLPEISRINAENLSQLIALGAIIGVSLSATLNSRSTVADPISVLGRFSTVGFLTIIGMLAIATFSTRYWIYHLYTRANNVLWMPLSCSLKRLSRRVEMQAFRLRHVRWYSSMVQLLLGLASFAAVNTTFLMEIPSQTRHDSNNTLRNLSAITFLRRTGSLEASGFWNHGPEISLDWRPIRQQWGSQDSLYAFDDSYIDIDIETSEEENWIASLTPTSPPLKHAVLEEIASHWCTPSTTVSTSGSISPTANMKAKTFEVVPTLTKSYPAATKVTAAAGLWNGPSSTRRTTSPAATLVAASIAGPLPIVNEVVTYTKIVVLDLKTYAFSYPMQVIAQPGSTSQGINASILGSLIGGFVGILLIVTVVAIAVLAPWMSHLSFCDLDSESWGICKWRNGRSLLRVKHVHIQQVDSCPSGVQSR